MSRKIARELSVKLLYQYDFQQEKDLSKIDRFIEEVLEEKMHDEKPIKDLTPEDKNYIKGVVGGTLEHLEDIDKKIEDNVQGWTLKRIAKVDLAILRLSIYEILYREDIPKEVSINEAVEMAKKYSTEDARTFVNGVLGKVVK